MDSKYYKVLNAEYFSPTAKFDYAKYLPNGDSAGDWLPEIDSVQILKEGYYASKYWNFWYTEGARIFEVELRGVCKQEICGVEKQVCAAQMRLLRDVTDELLPMLKEKSAPDVDSNNCGVSNTGRSNIGSSNAGDFNIGSRNTGKLNAGDFNTGDSNTGIDNVGDNNRGSSNAGSSNVGHSNTGSFNIGSYNSGSGNVGNFNAGSFNAGNHNVGKWNVGDYNVGFFNTQPPPARLFNKFADLSQEKIKLPKWLNVKDCKGAFMQASKEEILQALELPNFDYQIFESITGISKKDFQDRFSRL